MRITPRNRLQIMSLGSHPQGSDVSAESWVHYRQAFRRFAATIRTIQTVTEQPNIDQVAIDEAILRWETARAHYINCRNTLALLLLPAPRRGILRTCLTYSPGSDSERVRAIAELLWQTAGKPPGTAETDWYRAERIVRRASPV